MTGHISKSVTVIVLIIGLASQAQSSDLVADGGFDTGIGGWHLVGRGSLAHIASGSGSPGALRIDGGLAGNRTQAIAGYCVTGIVPGQEVSFSASFDVIEGAPSSCRIAIFESERSDCRWIELGSQARRTLIGSAWNPLSLNAFVAGPATRSLELRLHCATAEGVTSHLAVAFDDVHLNPADDFIFADDFESQCTDRWSSTIP